MLCTTATNTSNTIRTQTGAAVEIFPSHFTSKVVKTCFFILFECPAVTGHTSAFISRISSFKSVCCDFYIFCSDALIACPLFNLVRNSVVHSPPSVIRDQRARYGNVSTCSSSSFWMSMRHAMPSLAITLVLSTLMSIGCICGWLGGMAQWLAEFVAWTKRQARLLFGWVTVFGRFYQAN